MTSCEKEEPTYNIESEKDFVLKSKAKEEPTYNIESKNDFIKSKTKEDQSSLKNLTWSDFPMDAWDLVDFLNSRNFTHGRYEDCNEELTSVYYSAQFGTELASEHHDYEYTIGDLQAIVTTLWSKVRETCGTNRPVIVDIEFSVGFFTTTNDDYYYYIDANVTICCDPNLRPIEDPIPYPAALSKG